MTPREARDWPPDEQLAALESRGRLLLAGRVIDFDGAPCPGAQLWCEGEPVATCDADGAYRVELPRPLFALGGARRRGSLYAVAAGVGTGVANYGDRSGSLDVPLLWRARLRGTAIDAVTRQPVGGASVEFLAIASSSDLPDWKLAATTDAAGRFEFVGLPPFRAALRANASPLATPGWQRFDTAAPVASLPKVDGVADGIALEVEFELHAAIELRGQFVPWPPPIDAAQAATARLEVLPAASQLATDVEQWSVPLAADGSFRCPIARTFDAALSLAVDCGVLWRGDRRIDGDETVIDLGRIELAEPSAIELHVDLPRELLELGATATLREISGWGGPWRAPIGSDGRVRFAPFDSRQLKIAVRLGETGSYFNSGDIDPLRPGEQRELRVGGLAPRAGGLLVAGRVVDADGQPGVGVALSLVVPIEGAPITLTATSDRLGVYCFPSRVWGKQTVLARGASIELLARGRCGFARVALDSTLPAQWSARRVDVTLAAGASLRGVVVDAGGAPLANGVLELSPVSGDRVEQVAGPIELDLDERGTFAIDSLEPRDYAARIRGPSGWLELGIVRPGGTAVTLRLPAGIR